MKSLEADALQAQAVIVKAQEMSREPVHRSDNTAASNFSTVDIAFAGWCFCPKNISVALTFCYTYLRINHIEVYCKEELFMKNSVDFMGYSLRFF